MSLHLGNLSPRIRKDELERIFRRFGRCTVQVKDGFGFAVYDFRGDAEKALQALKGRKICGERIYLSWSNKQPKPLQGSPRTDGSHDVKYARTSGRVNNHIGRDLFKSRGNYTMNNNRPDGGGARQKIEEVPDDSFNHKNGELKSYHQKEEFLEEDRYIDSSQVDNGRRVERVDNLRNVNRDDEEMGFDRYEPDRVDEREEYEHRSLGHAEGSPSREMLLDKSNRVRHADSVRNHFTCFKCGAPGHKMRDCPLEDALPGKSLNRSGRTHEIETIFRSRERGEVRGAESRSRRSLQPNSRNSRPARRNEADGKPSHSERNVTNGRSSPMDNVSNSTNRKDYNRERQRERQDQTEEMHDGKRSKRLPHLHSDQTSPQLGKYSRSVKPSPDTISRSRSESPVMCSPSHRSRSKKRSNQSRPGSIKSKSRSGSSSPSSSLSTSLYRSLPSSPNREGIVLNGSFGGAPNPQFKEKLTEVYEESERDIGDEKVSIKDKPEAGFSGNIDDSSHRLEEDSIERQQLEVDLEDENATSINHAEVCLKDSLDDQIPQSQQVMAVKNSPQIGDVPVQSEDISFALEMRDDMKMNQLHDDDNSSSVVPLVSREIKVPSLSSVEKLRETEKLENGNGLKIMKSLETSYELDPKAPSKAHVGSHLSISTEELCKVLKHYGLKHSEDDEQKPSVEDYLGSARLWPWALIYYRRLKKGPVSEENYARRVAQNKAFGITDKYIRSSSGWGELSQLAEDD